MRRRIDFKASPTAAEALQLDDIPGVRRIGQDLYSAEVQVARAILRDAEARSKGPGRYGSENVWRAVRPCRAVANRIKLALTLAGAQEGSE